MQGGSQEFVSSEPACSWARPRPKHLWFEDSLRVRKTAGGYCDIRYRDSVPLSRAAELTCVGCPPFTGYVGADRRTVISMNSAPFMRYVGADRRKVIFVESDVSDDSPPLSDSCLEPAHLLINVPASQIGDALTRFLTDQKDNPGLSACVFVPQMRKLQNASFMPLLHGCPVIAQFERHDDIFETAQGVTFLAPWPARVYYVQAISQHLSVMTGLDSPLLFPCLCGGAPATLLMDTGAGGNFVSESFCQERGLQSLTPVAPRQITLADGHQVTVDRQCLVCLDQGHFFPSTSSAHAIASTGSTCAGAWLACCSRGHQFFVVRTE